MDQKNISPNPQQPVDRQPTGKLPNLLAELEEASLGDTDACITQGMCFDFSSKLNCSYDGEDE